MELDSKSNYHGKILTTFSRDLNCKSLIYLLITILGGFQNIVSCTMLFTIHFQLCKLKSTDLSLIIQLSIVGNLNFFHFNFLNDSLNMLASNQVYGKREIKNFSNNFTTADIGYKLYIYVIIDNKRSGIFSVL